MQPSAVFRCKHLPANEREETDLVSGMPNVPSRESAKIRTFERLDFRTFSFRQVGPYRTCQICQKCKCVRFRPLSLNCPKTEHFFRKSLKMGLFTFRFQTEIWLEVNLIVLAYKSSQRSLWKVKVRQLRVTN